MLNVGFVVTPDFPVMSLAALSVFEFANLSSGKELYNVQILSENGGAIAALGGAKLDTVPLSDARFDTLIIGGNIDVVPTSAGMAAFIVAAAKSARRMSSICTGAFALADAGLLHGRRVTTHWLFTKQFASKFPQIRLEKDRIFVVDGPIWTAAGNSAGIDLALHMLESDYGVGVARSVARIMVVDVRRSGGQPQISALLEMNAKSDRIQKTLAFARGNLQASLTVDSLAHVAGLGPRQFNRAFRTETGTSPAKAIEAIRLEAARLMLQQSSHSIDVIACETGFHDSERMRRAFIRDGGESPQAVRKASRGRSDGGLR